MAHRTATSTRASAPVPKTLASPEGWVKMPQSPPASATGTSANAVMIHQFQAFLDLRGPCSVVVTASA